MPEDKQDSGSQEPAQTPEPSPADSAPETIATGDQQPNDGAADPRPTSGVVWGQRDGGPARLRKTEQPKDPRPTAGVTWAIGGRIRQLPPSKGDGSSR
jgi:hypothetical protein